MKKIMTLLQLVPIYYSIWGRMNFIDNNQHSMIILVNVMHNNKQCSIENTHIKS